MPPKLNAKKTKRTPLRRAVPPHMDECHWLNFQRDAVLDLYKNVAKHLKRLSKNSDVDTVHDARVVLRRFDSIWRVLKQDGWESKKFKRTLGNDLKEIRKMLGSLRDWDVNLEIAKEYSLPEDLIESWQIERQLLAQGIAEELKDWDAKLFLRDLKDYLKKRSKKILKNAKKNGIELKQSAYIHLEPYLVSQEVVSQDLAKKAKAPAELHQLRLAIKGWRYLLTEFFGLTNLELVRAQQILGKLNDLTRVTDLVQEHATESKKVTESLGRISQQREKLLGQFKEFRNNLPFGLRPSVSSIIEQH